MAHGARERTFWGAFHVQMERSSLLPRGPAVGKVAAGEELEAPKAASSRKMAEDAPSPVVSALLPAPVPLLNTQGEGPVAGGL